MSVTKEQAAALYAAVFNRAPDQAGLDFWTQQDDFAVMAAGFVTHPVFENKYGEMSNEDFVKAIYENLLQGAGDDEGVNYWIERLDNEEGFSRGDFLASFIDAALNYEGDDAAALTRKAALENQVKVGLFYTEKMGEKSNLSEGVDAGSLDVVNDPAFVASQEAVVNVTADPATVAAAEKAITDKIAAENMAEDLAAALETYQGALDTKAAKDKAALELAKELNEELKLGLDKDGLTAKDVKDSLEDKVKELDEAVRDASAGTEESGGAQQIAKDAKLTDEALEFARDGLVRDVALQQAQVDALKEKGPAAVALQEKVAAHNSVYEDVAVAKTAVNSALVNYNHGVMVQDDQAKYDWNSNTVTVKVKVGEGEEAEIPTLTLSYDDKGALVIKNGDAKASAAEIAAFNATKHADTVKGALKAVYTEQTNLAAAQKAVDNALIAALKADGFKPFTPTTDGEKGDLKLANWSDAVKGGEVKIALYTDVKKNADGKYVKSTSDDAKLIEEGQLYSKAGTISLTEPATDGFENIYKIATGSEAAVDAKVKAEKAVKDFDAAVKAYKEAVVEQDKLTAARNEVDAAGKAVDAAKEAVEKVGVNLVKVSGNQFDGDVYNEDDPDQKADLFVYEVAMNEKDLNNFDGEDYFYFGDKAAKLVVLSEDKDVAKGNLGGDKAVLEIFAKETDNGVDLYVEKAAFAGNSATAAATNEDLVKITLTGVAAADLQFEDGFLTLA